MSKDEKEKVYKGELFKIKTEDGGIEYVPGTSVTDCDGLAICMVKFGEYNITHVASGNKLAGGYERLDNAIVDTMRFSLIAATYNFSWEDELPIKNIKKILDEKVPFDVGTEPDDDVERRMTIGTWIQLLRPRIPGYAIDTQQWEESFGYVADKIANQIKRTKEKL